ncbi:hypothetical protein MHU86_6071 [Fragilaria crotonensis]|nr:hypothetical protein MHU86_25724 [Fragilaria crotonensis]KAI2499935.1 hypothetical protein MHU86_14556 [Fragilaria crotonensis]KAI2504913.1 hypothetical protein MHU86_9522 [Fragilaria crotonensis]KAI2508397.1 hypothetical protein MHU86_6071 [Fragilaria crotonensis]
MVDKGKYAILTDAVMLLRTDITYGPRLSNCWLPASTWAEALGRFDVNASLGVIDVRRFNTGMSKSASFGELMHRFDGSNTTGVFRVTYKNTFYYYFTEKSRQIRYPCPLNSAWNEKVMEAAANVLVIPSTRSRPALDTMITTPVNTEATTGGRIGDIVEQSPSKRARIGDTGAAAVMIAADASSSSYWPCSPEAYRVFKPPKKHGTTNCEDGNDTDFDSETPMEALQRRIVLLQSVHEEENNWRNVVQGRDIDNVCTKAEICAVRQRATFLCYAYRLALAKMNEWTWQDCCTESLWKRPLPRVLEVFPCAKEQIVAFGVENLSHLSIEAVYQFVHSSVIPRLAALWKRESVVDEDTAETSTLSTSTTAINPTSNPVDVDQDEDDIALFLRAHRLKNMSFTTAWRWMRLLGFKYDTRRKSFYVDGHEREDVVAHRNAFCKNYLTVLEPRCRRWIQLPLSEAATIKTLDTDFGHHYYDIISDETRVEFHVDYWKNCISRIKREKRQREMLKQKQAYECHHQSGP